MVKVWLFFLNQLKSCSTDEKHLTPSELCGRRIASSHPLCDRATLDMGARRLSDVLRVTQLGSTEARVQILTKWLQSIIHSLIQYSCVPTTLLGLPKPRILSGRDRQPEK